MWYFLIFIFTLALDQITKTAIDAYNVKSPLIDGVLNITNARNPGASFSFLAGVEWAQTFFIALTAVTLTAGLLYVIFTRKKSKWLFVSIALMFSGTIGNFIDRIAFGEVRDFIDVVFFANFNVADSCLCVGAFMLVVFILFIDTDAVFAKKKPLKNAE